MVWHVEVGDRVHPATSELPVEWARSDEWLNWSPNPACTASKRGRSAPGASIDHMQAASPVGIVAGNPTQYVV